MRERELDGGERAAEAARLKELADNPALRDWQALGLVIRRGEAHLVHVWTPLLVLNQRAWAKSAIRRVRRTVATDGRQGEPQRDVDGLHGDDLRAMADNLAVWLSDPYSPVGRERIRSIPAFALRTLLLPDLPTVETVADLDLLIGVLLDTAQDHVDIGTVIEDDEYSAASSNNVALGQLIELGMWRLIEARTAEFSERHLYIQWVLRDTGSAGRANPALWASRGLEPMLAHTEPLITGLGCRSEQELMWEAATTLVGDAQSRNTRNLAGARRQ